MRKVLILLIISLSWLNVQAQDKKPANIAGDWTLTMTTPRGERASELTITQEGVEAVGETEDEEFEISIDGDEVSWEQTMSTPMGEIEVKFVGTVDGNDMEGTMTMSGGPMDGQEIEWTATRKEKNSPAR